jgi:hypothetical protein
MPLNTITGERYCRGYFTSENGINTYPLIGVRHGRTPSFPVGPYSGHPRCVTTRFNPAATLSLRHRNPAQKHGSAKVSGLPKWRCQSLARLCNSRVSRMSRRGLRSRNVPCSSIRPSIRSAVLEKFSAETICVRSAQISQEPSSETSIAALSTGDREISAFSSVKSVYLGSRNSYGIPYELPSRVTQLVASEKQTWDSLNCFP